MRVFYEEQDICVFGELIKTVKSEIDSCFDLAYIKVNGLTAKKHNKFSFDCNYKVALLSQINYI